MENMNFICQILTGLIANILSGYILYYFLENKVKKLSDRQRIISAKKSLSADLKFITIISKKIIDNKYNYLKNGVIPHFDFPNSSLNKFIAEASNILTEGNITDLITFRENINITNNFLYKLRNHPVSYEDKDKTINELIPSIYNSVPKISEIINNLE